MRGKVIRTDLAPVLGVVVVLDDKLFLVRCRVVPHLPGHAVRQRGHELRQQGHEFRQRGHASGNGVVPLVNSFLSAAVWYHTCPVRRSVSGVTSCVSRVTRQETGWSLW